MCTDTYDGIFFSPPTPADTIEGGTVIFTATDGGHYLWWLWAFISEEAGWLHLGVSPSGEVMPLTAEQLDAASSAEYLWLGSDARPCLEDFAIEFCHEEVVSKYME
jgi:hypothetical protein